MSITTLRTTNATATAIGDIPQQKAPYKSKWKTTDAVPLNAESLMDLLKGRTPLLKQGAFLSAETAAKMEAELEARFTPYLHATGPAVDKVGVAQFEFQAQSQEDFKNRTGLGGWSSSCCISSKTDNISEKDQYFQTVRKVSKIHEELATKVGVNVFAKVFEAFATIVPPEWEICLASESQDQQYFAGIIRGINNGTPIHCDWVPYDTMTEPWAITRVTHQAVFNLYLSDVVGGDTQIHDVQWSPEALAYRDPASYGYFPGLVDGKRRTRFHPNAGDLYVFNSQNMHQVFPVEPGCNKRRMGMASFFGILPPLASGDKTKLIFWS